MFISTKTHMVDDIKPTKTEHNLDSIITLHGKDNEIKKLKIEKSGLDYILTFYEKETKTKELVINTSIEYNKEIRYPEDFEVLTKNMRFSLEFNYYHNNKKIIGIKLPLEENVECDYLKFINISVVEGTFGILSTDNIDIYINIIDRDNEGEIKVHTKIKGGY